MMWSSKKDGLAMIKVQNKKAIRSRVVDPQHWRGKQRGSDYRIREIIQLYRGRRYASSTEPLLS